MTLAQCLQTATRDYADVFKNFNVVGKCLKKTPQLSKMTRE